MATLSNGLNFHAEPPPLRMEEWDVIRVGKTRISLDLVVEQSENGISAEDKVRAYDTLVHAEVHPVLAYYLKNKAEVNGR